MVDIGVIFTCFLILLTIGVLALLAKIFSSLKYFTKRNIPYEKPKGMIGIEFPSKSMPFLLWDMYKQSGSHKLYGFFVLWNPSILIKDLDLIKLILVKNFNSFYDRGVYYNEKSDPLSAHLFALEGETWKRLRVKLSPVFTSGKLKMMFPTVMKNGEKLISYIAEKPATESLECFKLTAKFTLSNIANTAFGIESDLFEENSKFMEMVLKNSTPNLEQVIRSFVLFQMRNLVELLPSYRIIPRDISDFFIQVVKDAISFREDKTIMRNDFLQMLIQLKNKGSLDDTPENGDGDLLTMNQLYAQAFVFLVGGFETSALAQSFTLYELALNPDIQRRLQAELDGLELWSYENILALEYLDMVISETLRKYPTVPFIVRRCNEDFKVPDSDIVIEKGSDVNISVYGLHRDPELFPEPDKYDPERFGPKPTHEIKPYSYLPFGEGPRFCIGMRFGKMQTKIGIAMLMKHYSVEPTAKTMIPMVLHPNAVQPTARDGVWLKFTPRSTELSFIKNFTT